MDKEKEIKFLKAYEELCKEHRVTLISDYEIFTKSEEQIDSHRRHKVNHEMNINKTYDYFDSFLNHIIDGIYEESDLERF